MGGELAQVDFERGGLSPYRDGRAFLRLVGLYRNTAPTLIHHFNAKPVLLGSLAARVAAREAAVVNTITGLGNLPSVGGWREPILHTALRGACRRAQRTIFQNREDRDHYVERGWIGTDRARLIVSSGVDTELFHPVERGPENGLTVLMVSRLLAQKGVESFLETARQVRAVRPEVIFQLAGEWEPDHPDALRSELVEESVARGEVEFLGYVGEIEKLLPRVSLFVFPSHYREGVPRVILEAAACGVPTVAVDIAGSRVAIEPGQTGWLVPPDSVEALTDVVLDALGDKKRLAHMGRLARERVLEEFDLVDITRKQLDVYRELGLGFEEPSP